MLRVIKDDKPEVLTPITDLKISHKDTGIDLVTFEISEEHPYYPYLNGDNIHLEYKDILYTVEKIQDGDIQANITLDSLKQDLIMDYSQTDTCLKLLLKVPGLSSWKVSPKTPITDVALKVDMEQGTSFDLVSLIAKTFALNLVWKNQSQILEVYEPANAIPSGDYLTDELNLISLTYRKDTSRMVTRLYCFGADGLTFSNINEGKPYVEDFTHTERVISQVWTDGRYKVPENLLDKGREKLQSLCKPIISYECRVVDLARLNPDYNFLSFQLHKKIGILDRKRKQRVEYVIVAYDEFPDEPDRNVVTLSTVPERIKSIVEKGVDDLLDNPDSKLNEKIETNSGDIMGIRVAPNLSQVTLGTLGSELTSIPYVNNAQAWVSYHTVAYFTVTTAGVIKFQLTLDQVEFAYYEEYFELGNFFKVITYAINSSPGSHTVRTVVLADSAKATFPLGKSQSHILSAGITPEIPWDGTIKIIERIPYLGASLPLLGINNMIDLSTLDMKNPEEPSASELVSPLTPLLIPIYYSKPLQNFHLPSSNQGAYYVDLNHIAILFDNAIEFDGTPDLLAWAVAGGVGGVLTPVDVLSLTPLDRYLLIETSSFSSFDQDFLVGYSGGNLVNSISRKVTQDFSLPFSKSITPMAINMLTASSEFSATYPAANLLNNNNSQLWAPMDADFLPTLYLQLNKVGQLLNYTMRARADNITGAPRAWVMEALIEGDWVEINSQASQTWTVGQEKTFVISSPEYYQIIRIRITESNPTGRGFSKLRITEVT